MPPHAAAICDTQQERPLEVLDESDNGSAAASLSKKLEEEGCSKSSEQKTKSVAFADDDADDDDDDAIVTVREIMHHSEYSVEERKSTWMNMLDVFRIRQDNVDTFLSKGHIRGLESYISQVVQERRATIEFARTVVMKHQEPGVEMDYLAFLYGSASMKSKDTAYSRGLMDERIAMSLD
jgi:hypothetical protein